LDLRLNRLATVDEGQPAKNDTHVSRTDPGARYPKADGRKAAFAHLAHVLLDNRHGPIHGAWATARISRCAPTRVRIVAIPRGAL
jgi:hypothetical protein